MKSLQDYVKQIDALQAPAAGDAIDLVINEEVAISAGISDVQQESIFVDIDPAAFQLLEEAGLLDYVSEELGMISEAPPGVATAAKAVGQGASKAAQAVKNFGASMPAGKITNMFGKVPLKPAVPGVKSAVPAAGKAAAPAAGKAAAPAATKAATKAAPAATKAATKAAPAAGKATAKATAKAAPAAKGSSTAANMATGAGLLGAGAGLGYGISKLTDKDKPQPGPGPAPVPPTPGPGPGPAPTPGPVDTTDPNNPYQFDPNQPDIPLTPPDQADETNPPMDTITDPYDPATDPSLTNTTQTGSTDEIERLKQLAIGGGSPAAAAPAAAAPAQQNTAAPASQGGYAQSATGAEGQGAPASSGLPNPWEGKDPAKAAAWSQLSPEDQKWIGKADPTDKYILNRAPSKGGFLGSITPNFMKEESQEFDRMLELAGIDNTGSKKKINVTESRQVSEAIPGVGAAAKALGKAGKAVGSAVKKFIPPKVPASKLARPPQIAPNTWKLMSPAQKEAYVAKLAKQNLKDIDRATQGIIMSWVKANPKKAAALGITAALGAYDWFTLPAGQSWDALGFAGRTLDRGMNLISAPSSGDPEVDAQRQSVGGGGYAPAPAPDQTNPNRAPGGFDDTKDTIKPWGQRSLQWNNWADPYGRRGTQESVRVIVRNPKSGELMEVKLNGFARSEDREWTAHTWTTTPVSKVMKGKQ